MMACSYLSASGSSGMKVASTSAACWTPPTIPGCMPELEGPSMLATPQPYMQPPGLIGLMPPTPGLEPMTSALTQPPPRLAPKSSVMSTPRVLAPTLATLAHEPALDLSTTPSLKPPPTSSPSEDETE